MENQQWPASDIAYSKDELTSLHDRCVDSLCKFRSLAVDGDLEDSMVDEIEYDYTRYLTIRSTGHLEFTFEKCIEALSNMQTRPEMANLVQSTLFKGANPSQDRILGRLGVLNSNWKESFKYVLDKNDGELKATLKEMVRARNKFSHGQNVDTGFESSKRYYRVSMELADELISIMRPDPAP